MWGAYMCPHEAICVGEGARNSNALEEVPWGLFGCLQDHAILSTLMDIYGVFTGLSSIENNYFQCDTIKYWYRGGV
jgi:hypothetical protein